MSYYDYDYSYRGGFEDLKGRTITAIERKEDYELKFACADGDVFRLCHHQDCCESVYIEDICGDLDDLIGTPILVAEERTEDEPDDGEYGDISGWTFYELRTIKGSVTIRWHGSSNGYYSIGVDFDRLKKQDD